MTQRYAKVEQGVIVKFPYTDYMIQQDNPRTSLAKPMNDTSRAKYNAFPVAEPEAPDVDLSMNVVTRWSKPRIVDGACIIDWDVRPKTAEEINTEVELGKQALQSQISQAVQQRLDAFAQTRLYSSLLSACTYATSGNPKFAKEGQYAVEARDATWTALYQVLAEVEAGARALPSGLADIEDVLPTLEWPE